MASSSPSALCAYLSSALTESFAAFGIRLDPATATDDESLDGDLMAAIMGVHVDGEPGTFVLALGSVDLDLVGSSLKIPEAMVNDWLGEAANQCVGRLKLALLRHGIVARMMPPSVTEATGQLFERYAESKVVVKQRFTLNGDGTLTCLFAGDAEVLRSIADVAPGAELPQPGDVIHGAPVAAPGAPAATRRKVLIVEDSATMRQQLAEALRPLGAPIIEAEHGDDGLAKLAAHPDIGLVISDVNMPWKSGLEMLEEIRANPDHRGLAIIMLTTEGNPAEIKKAKALGIKAWLLKPIDPGALLQVVSKLIADKAA